jgi:hypothetical protein
MCGAFLIITTKQMNMFNVPLSSRPFLAPYDDTATGRDRRKSTQHSAGTIPSFVPEADEGVAPMTPLLPSVAGDGVGLELGDGARIIATHAESSAPVDPSKYLKPTLHVWILLSAQPVVSFALFHFPATQFTHEESSAVVDPSV